MAGNFTQLTTIEIELKTSRLRTAQPFAFALAFAFLVVIPEGDLLLDRKFLIPKILQTNSSQSIFCSGKYPLT
jgi:hypothetical protein